MKGQLRKHNKDGVVTEEFEAIPSEIRIRSVAVKRHFAPDERVLNAMLARWSDVYKSTRRDEMPIIVVAAAHHRLAWIHPFVDGNGRTARLHTFALL